MRVEPGQCRHALTLGQKLESDNRNPRTSAGHRTGLTGVRHYSVMTSLNFLPRGSLVALVEHRARAEQIVRVFVRYGLAEGADLSGHPHLADLAKGMKPDPDLMALSRGERLRAALLELGTTFIKIGQILSTRPDLVGPDVAEDLAVLQADDPVDTPEEIVATLAEAFNCTSEQALARFSSFNLVPIASASIGQVCLATLTDGTQVVVKVRHTGVVDVVREDLAILNALASILQHDVPSLRIMEPERTVAELSKSLIDELDFRIELRNLLVVSGNFADNPTYVFPTAYPELSAESVLTESMVDGTRLSNVIKSLGGQADLIVHELADLYFQMIFEDGVFHADPHPGNLLIIEGGRVGVLDFGKCGHLRESTREAFVDFLSSIFSGDIDETVRCMLVISPGPRSLDETALAADLAEWINQYFPRNGNPGGAHTDLGASMQALLTLVNRYQLKLPTDLSLMLLVVIQLQGLLEESGSQLTLTELLKPFAVRLKKERLSPQRLLRTAARTAHRWERLLEVMPGDLTRMFEAGSKGELKVPLDVNGIDKPVNRLAMALIGSAAILGASNMLSRRVHPMVGKVSVPGAIAGVASIVIARQVMRGVHRAGGM